MKIRPKATPPNVRDMNAQLNRLVAAGAYSYADAIATRGGWARWRKAKPLK